MRRASRSPRRSSATTSRCSLRVLPLLEDGDADRRAHPAARRHRPAAPRPHAAVEGRDDPRDPPPGEEQPADDRVAAAAPGPAAAVARGQGRARRVGAADPLDRDRARDAVARTRATSCASARSCARSPGWSRTPSSSPELTDPLQRRRRRRRAAGRGRDAARGRAQRADAERGRPRVPRGRARGHEVDVLLGREDESRRRSRSSTTAPGCPSGSRSRQSQGLGLSIVQALVTGELDGSIEMHSDDGTSVRVRVPVAMPRVELCSGRRAQPTRSFGSWTSVQPLRSRRRSSSVRPPHTPASWLVAERELEALAGDRALAADPLAPPRSGRARRRWSRSGRTAPGSCRGTRRGRATPPRPSRASGSRSAPLRFPLRGSHSCAVLCARSHACPVIELPGTCSEIGRVTAVCTTAQGV